MSRLNPSSTRVSGNDVFISYSRKDQSFVRRLDEAFRQLNRDPWVDWDEIHKGEEWWQAIQRGIEGADTFVFVISPDSIASSVCREEIEHAAQHNKRFLPIVRREGFDPKQVHPRVSSHNWLFFRETDDFGVAFEELQKAIDMDLEHARAHTRLLVRAIEWQAKNQNSSYLLRGADLEDAKQWLISSTSKEPQPTELQAQYVNAGIKAEADRLKALRRTRRTVVLTTILANILLAVGSGIWFYLHQMEKARQIIQTDMIKALRMGTLGTNGGDFAALANLGTSQGSNAAIASPLYQTHQQWLSSIRTVFPDTITRTYIDGGPEKILWVGDIARNLPGERAETKFLESVNAKHSERNVFEGKEMIIMAPYTDRLGRWISASGPIKNAGGEIVGGMKVYYSENYLINEQDDVRKALIIAYLIIVFWLLVLSVIILRALRPVESDQ